MPDTTRLVAKLDEAIRALKPQRRHGDPHGSRLAEELRERFRVGRPFTVAIAGREYPVKCDGIRVSRTTVDLGIPDVDGTIPLTRVTACEHGRDAQGNPIVGLGLLEPSGAITPIAVN